MNMLWLALALSASAAGLTRVDWRWEAALWCVEAAYVWPLCAGEPGRLSACESAVVEGCLWLTGAEQRDERW